MADIFLRSTDGNDGNAGTEKEAAKATLSSALTAAGAGGRIFTSGIHAETQASAMTLASPGTAGSPVQVLCVEDWGAETGSTPPTSLATTATISTTGNNSIVYSGHTYSYGVTYSAGDSTGTASLDWFSGSTNVFWIVEDCSMILGGSGSLSVIDIRGSFGSAVEFHNVVVKFGAVNQGINTRSRFDWNGGSLDGTGSIPTNLIKQSNGSHGVVQIRGVDLSAMGSGKSLVQAGISASSQFMFQRCKIGASVAVISGTIATQSGELVKLINCDSGDTNYRFESYSFPGSIIQETTIIRTGGASDGTTGVSRKMVTNANSHLFAPLVLDGIVTWNEAVGGSLTATVEVVTDNVTLTDKEAWLEVEYLGTSGFPLSLFADDRAADDAAHLGSGANQTTSSETWTTTGLTTPVKQALSVTFTPQEKGPIRFRVMLAKPSTTMYVCPKVGVA